MPSCLSFLCDAMNPQQVCFDLQHGATTMIGPDNESNRERSSC